MRHSIRSFLRLSILTCAFAVTVGFSQHAAAADLPKSTRDMLAALKMDASILAGLHQKLKMPEAWIAGAKREGKVRYIGNFTNREWPAFIAPFKARYPFVQISHQRTSRVGRVDKPLIAFKQGRPQAFGRRTRWRMSRNPWSDSLDQDSASSRKARNER